MPMCPVDWSRTQLKLQGTIADNRSFCARRARRVPRAQGDTSLSLALSLSLSLSRSLALNLSLREWNLVHHPIHMHLIPSTSFRNVFSPLHYIPARIPSSDPIYRGPCYHPSLPGPALLGSSPGRHGGRGTAAGERYRLCLRAGPTRHCIPKSPLERVTRSSESDLKPGFGALRVESGPTGSCLATGGAAPTPRAAASRDRGNSARPTALCAVPRAARRACHRCPGARVALLRAWPPDHTASICRLCSRFALGKSILARRVFVLLTVPPMGGDFTLLSAVKLGQLCLDQRRSCVGNRAPGMGARVFDDKGA
jgi:hypothetical protein